MKDAFIINFAFLYVLSSSIVLNVILLSAYSETKIQIKRSIPKMKFALLKSRIGMFISYHGSVLLIRSLFSVPFSELATGTIRFSRVSISSTSTSQGRFPVLRYALHHNSLRIPVSSLFYLFSEVIVYSCIFTFQFWVHSAYNLVTRSSKVF